MNVCKKCGKKQGYFYICPHCEGRFCKSHQLPEVHNCVIYYETSTHIIEDEKMIEEFVYYPNPRIIEALEIIKNRENAHTQPASLKP
jgi:hypothetical protein